MVGVEKQGGSCSALPPRYAFTGVSFPEMATASASPCGKPLPRLPQFQHPRPRPGFSYFLQSMSSNVCGRRSAS